MNETNSRTQTEGTFEGWVILELMGHRKLGGYIKEATIAGASFLRIDVVDATGESTTTQFYQPTAVYCITPCTQDLAVKYGVNHQPQPVTRWELPAGESRRLREEAYDEVGRDDDDEEYT